MANLHPAYRLVLVCVLAFAACSKSPEVRKRERFERGNQYAAAQKYREAILEYRGAIQIDAKFGEARYALAKAYDQVGEPRNAFPEYVRAADLLPRDTDLQLKTATLLLATGQFEDARTRAQKVVNVDPKNVDALLLIASATAGLRDLKGAMVQAEAAIKLNPMNSRSYSTLGQLQIAGRNLTEAERAFKRAIEVAPTAAEPRLALANFYWNQKRPETEATLTGTLAIDPGNEAAHNALAIYYLWTNRVLEAEPHLKAVAATSTRPDAKVLLADYYLRVQPPRFSDSERVLNDPSLAKEASAKLEMAQLKRLQGKDSEGEQIVDTVLKGAPKNGAALTSKAHFLLGRKKLDEALASAQAAVTAEPDLAEAHFALGSVLSAKRDFEAATREFNEVLKLNPVAVGAQTELARLQLATGHPDVAVELAAHALKDQPNAFDTQLVMLRARLANGDIVQGTAQARLLVAQYPNSAAVQVLAGRFALLKGADAEARTAFQRALTIDPSSVEALTGMVSLDMKQRQPATAKARVDEAMAKNPTDGVLLCLAAGVYESAGDARRAEEFLRQAIEADAANIQAYGMLASLFLKQQRLDQALIQFEDLAKIQPKSVAAHTMVANILVQQRKLAEAQKRYEHVLQIDPRAAVAANNLAWLYAEGGKNLDVALQLAQTAKQEMPRLVQTDDTLGWIYYKKGLIPLALAALNRAVAAEPSNALYVYHLGLVQLKDAKTATARQTLERALKINPGFAGAEDARTVLQSLGPRR